MSVAYNLSNLPEPTAIEHLDFDEILQEILLDFKARDPMYTNTGLGDPIYTLAHVSATREMQLRARVNDAVRACMITHAMGSDLDNLAANYNVFRFVLQEADPEVDPPIPEILEDDDKLRERMILAWEQLAPGSPGWYKNHCLHADTDVFDVLAKESGTAGTVEVWVQSRSGNGVPSNDLITTVSDYLNIHSNRFLNDVLDVQPVAAVVYDITAELTIATGALASEIRDIVEGQVHQFCEANRRIGRSIPLSAIYAVLNQEFVQAVDLTSPTGNVVLNDPLTKGQPVQIPVCGTVTITVT